MTSCFDVTGERRLISRSFRLRNRTLSKVPHTNPKSELVCNFVATNFDSGAVVRIATAPRDVRGHCHTEI